MSDNADSPPNEPQNDLLDLSSLRLMPAWVGDFGKPDNRAWRGLYFAYLRFFVPLFGKIFCGDGQTHAYILESLKHYPAQHGVAAKMREMGCRDVRIVPLLGGVMTINCGVKP